MIEAGPGDYMIADAYRDQVALNVINRDNLANLIASVRQQAEDAMRERAAREVDRLARIAAHSPFWQPGTDQQLEGLATAIRGIDAGGEGE